jgi:hypothetical protein
MTKFFALFMIPASVVDEWKKNTKPEEMKSASEKMMHDWEKWQKAHQKNLVDTGAPLGKTKRVSSKKISDVRNDLNWYSIVEAESHDAAARLFEDNPHLQIPGSSIEVMEIPAGPAT